MLVLKYVKQGGSRFISHIDLLRHSSRIIRRAGIPVKYSNGFNPHALVFFSPPLVLGAGSLAEYISIDTDISAEELFERYNSAVSQDMRATCVFSCGKNPNLQGKIVAADYVFPMEYTDIDLSKEFIVEYEKKGERVLENVADKIFAAEKYIDGADSKSDHSNGSAPKDGSLLLRLATGNVNLRPDRVIAELNRRYGLDMRVSDVMKVRQYVSVDGELIEADEYLGSL